MVAGGTGAGTSGDGRQWNQGNPALSAEWHGSFCDEASFHVAFQSRPSGRHVLARRCRACACAGGRGVRHPEMHDVVDGLRQRHQRAEKTKPGSDDSDPGLVLRPANSTSEPLRLPLTADAASCGRRIRQARAAPARPSRTLPDPRVRARKCRRRLLPAMRQVRSHSQG